MLTNEKIMELMLEAIVESEKSVPEDQRIHPKVGSILSDLDGNILERSYRGEDGNGGHCEYNIIQKAKEREINFNETILFVTLEPCTSRGPGKIPCSQRIVESGISKVYIGMLDPNPLICGRGETYLRSRLNVERFPGDLIRRIEESNFDFVNQYRSQLLPNTSLYVSKQIPTLMIDYLQRSGLSIDALPVDWDMVVDDLVHYCGSGRCTEGIENLHDLVKEARRDAFDKKYFNYTYETDTRGLGEHWIKEFYEVLSFLKIEDIFNYDVINVGCGNGLEGQALFSNMERLTIVDVGRKSLENARVALPKAKTILADAEDLEPVATGSQDIYVSLRTYQSSYFDITLAIREAYRVVRPGGIVIISVANGFLGQKGNLIPGLVIPETNIVDKNRPFQVAEQIRRKLSLLKFEEVGIRTGLAEIYIYGRRTN